MNPQECYVCGRYSTSDRSNMRRHQVICREKFYCYHCAFKSKNKSELVDHMKKKHLPKQVRVAYKCKKCKYSSKELFNIKRHERKVCGLKLSCSQCDFNTENKKHLILHMKKHSSPSFYKCNICDFETKRPIKLKIHQLTQHKKCEYCDFVSNDRLSWEKHLRAKNHTSMLCSTCGKVYVNKYYYNQHLYNCSTIDSTPKIDSIQTKTAIKGMFKKITFTNFRMKKDLKKTLYSEMKDIICDALKSEANSQHGIKWSIAVTVSLYKIIDEGESWVEPVFTTPTQALHPYEEEIDLEPNFEKLNEKLELYCSLGSGWKLDEVLKIDLNVAKYNPLAGSSWIATPKKLLHKKMKHSLLNIKNTADSYCFKYSILAGIFNINSDSPEKFKEYEHELDFSGLTFPVKLHQVNIFERHNSNISVSIFGYENNNAIPLRISVSPNRKQHVDLLLITKEDQSHYILIRDKNALLRHIVYPKTHHEVFICDYCLNKLQTEQAYKNHVERCKLEKPQIVKYPSPEKNILKWESYHKKMKRPITIYADFETMTIQGKLIASSYAYLIVDDTHTPIRLQEHRAPENVVQHFLESILKDVDVLQKSRINHEVIEWTPEDKERYLKATHCHICEEPLDLTISDSNHPRYRVADHYHFEFPHTKPSPYNNPGKLRGAAHRECNAAFHNKFRVTVVFHNLKKFDGHLIIKEIAPYISNTKDFKCIARNIEEYSSFSLRNIDFIDSLEFFNESLDNIVRTLDKTNMKIMKNYFPEVEKFELLTRKGVFPYEYIDSYEKLEHESTLPPKEKFFSSLTDSGISDEDYEHAQKVWKTFNCNTLGQYQDIYNLCDVLLLADAFENFRSTMLKYYSQDPCHFISFPSLSWNAMLKMTKVELELISDPDIYLMFEQGIRGGLSVIPTRFAEAVQNESALLYVDCNNLYGAALSSYLPKSSFEFVSFEPLKSLEIIKKILETPDESDIGYICEVDLSVPDSLHDYMNDYPLAPCKKQVSSEQLSSYQKHLLQALNTHHVPTEKLIASLEPKTNYIIHYRNLKLYVELGMIVDKVHKIVQFKQAPWMKPYIDFNTQKRAEATSTFEQNLLKLASNSCFGRCLMNVRRHRNFTLITDEKKAKSYICKPTFHQFAIFNKDLVGILFNKTVISLDKPIYAGMVTLEISKLIMYTYYYKVLKPKYGDNMRLCMTDTDSLLLHLKTPNLTEDMKSLIDTLDTSNYHKDHPLYSDKRKKQVGYFKCETPNDEMISYVGLRAKMYSYETKNSQGKMVGKGIPRSNLKRMSFLDYKNSLFKENKSSVTFNQILSKNHTLHIKSQKKIALSPMDDKRYLLNDKINTFAFGHWKIAEIENEMDTDESTYL